MRDVYRRTRPLPREEWQQYWAFERINRRGVVVDLPFVRRAAALAAEDAVAIGRRLAELTDGAVTRVTQAKRIAAWLHDQLRRRGDARGADDRRSCDDDDDDDDDDEAEPHEFSLTRDRVARVLAMLDAKHANGGLDAAETKAREVATLRLYGAGASPKKFARLDAQQVDGVLRGQYRFAGAGQTGRLSSARRANSKPHPRCARRGWRRGSGARRCDRRRLQLCRAGRGGACRRAGGAQACPARASRPHCRAGESICLVGLVGDRGADHAVARRFGRRREGPRYFPRQRSRPDAAGHLHARRRRHPAQGSERGHEDGARHRQGGRPGARFRRLRRRAAAHGAELPHQSR